MKAVIRLATDKDVAEIGRQAGYKGMSTRNVKKGYALVVIHRKDGSCLTTRLCIMRLKDGAFFDVGREGRNTDSPNIVPYEDQGCLTLTELERFITIANRSATKFNKAVLQRRDLQKRIDSAREELDKINAEIAKLDNRRTELAASISYNSDLRTLASNEAKKHQPYLGTRAGNSVRFVAQNNEVLFGVGCKHVPVDQVHKFLKSVAPRIQSKKSRDIIANLPKFPDIILD